MPIIEMHLMSGRTVEQKRRVMAAVSAAAAQALDVDIGTVRILITEHGQEEFSVGGVSVGERSEAKQRERDAQRSAGADVS